MTKRFIHYLLLATILVALPSCSVRQMTLAPKPITSAEASFDGNSANSGIVEVGAEGFVVTPHWIARYDALLAKYGARLVPAVAAGDRTGVKASTDSYLVTGEVMVRFTRLNQWRKAEKN